MDLYGYNAGTSTSNEARSRVAQGNLAVLQFNKGLDAQVDTLKLEQKGLAEQNLTDTGQKLGATATNAIAKFALRSKGAKSAAQAAKVSLTASKAAAAASAPAAAAARIADATAVRAGESSIETSAIGRANLDAAEVAGERLVPKIAEEGAGVTLGKIAGVAGKGLGVLGGVATLGIEGYKLAESSTKFKDENWEQQVGQIASVAGGALQIVGALTAWTGFGLGVEAAGTALALGGAAAEEVGDEREASKTDPEAVEDVTSQKRTTAVAQSSGVEVSRSN
tara:strand:- start:950 stop:1789 length:840 start_codon:yes stop_codon:yes gene_type:complete